ncbi:MAG: C25 family cysteine peptidase [Chitinophagales bacterium]
MQKLQPFFLLLFLSFTSTSLSAQIYFNEWIDYNKTYYKFQVEENGVHQISYNSLIEAGLSDQIGNGFHLFSRGKEIPIYVSSNGTLQQSDYIEFYGEENDGSFDSQLFLFDDHQLTDQRSIFADAATYYLMWDNSFEGLRFQTVENDLTEPLPEKEPYFLHKENRFYKSIFYQGEPIRIGGVNYNYADFEKGEGWTSSTILGQTVKGYKLSTIGVSTDVNAPAAFLETKVVGENNDFFNFKDHHIQVTLGETTYIDEIYEGHDTPTYTAEIALVDLDELQTTVQYTSVGDIFSNPSEDWQSVSYTFLTYPRQFDFGQLESGNIVAAQKFAFSLQHSNEAYFEVSNFEGGTEAVLYDLSNRNRILINRSADDLYKIHLAEATSIEEKRQLILTNTEAVSNIAALTPQTFTNYQLLENQGNYIIIYHPVLAEGETNWVQEYVDYRESMEGGQHKVVLANIEELYDQFAHGINKHPLSIRHFVNFAIANWTDKPKLLFLMGKSIAYRSATTPSILINNLVPTFGHHPSDNYLTLSSKYDYRPQLGVGRLSARTSEQVRDYLQKVRDYENTGAANRTERLWRKHALFQSSGDNNNQYSEYENFLLDAKTTYESPLIGGKVLDIQAYKNYDEGFRTRPFIEEGIGLLYFMGHSTGQIWKTDVLENPIGYDQQIGRYPFIIAGTPFVGNIHKTHNSTPSMSETWTLSPNHGSIAYLSTVSFGFPSTLNIYGQELLRQLSDETYSLSIGEAMQKTASNIHIGSPTEPSYEGIKAAISEFTLQGDPAIKLAASHLNPEYVIENAYDFRYIDVENDYEIKTEVRNDVQMFNRDNGIEITSVDDVYDVTNIPHLQLKVRAGNLGKAIEGTFQVEVAQQDLDGSNRFVQKTETFNAPFYESMYEMDIDLEPTTDFVTYQLVVKVDASDKFGEDSEENNEVILNLQADEITSIDQLDFVNTLDIGVFPNPFTGLLQIEGELDRDAVLQLFDLQGRMVFQAQIKENQSINIPQSLGFGMYVLKISDESGVWMQKVVKE